MCWSGCALLRLLGVTPLLLVLRPENPCQTWDPRAKFRVLYRIELKVGGSAVRAPDLGPTSGKCPVCWSGCALLRLLGVTPLLLVLRPENPCQTWDPRAKFRVLYRIELKVGGSAVRAPDLGPTSGKCQCAGQGVPSYAY